MQAATARQLKSTGEASEARRHPSQSSRASAGHASWRWQYAAHPSLMPTVYVPGPVVTARKV